MAESDSCILGSAVTSRPVPAPAWPQDKHRRQFSPADKISEQPAAAIGAPRHSCMPLVT